MSLFARPFDEERFGCAMGRSKTKQKRSFLSPMSALLFFDHPRWLRSMFALGLLGLGGCGSATCLSKKPWLTRLDVTSRHATNESSWALAARLGDGQRGYATVGFEALRRRNKQIESETGSPDFLLRSRGWAVGIDRSGHFVRLAVQEKKTPSHRTAHLAGRRYHLSLGNLLISEGSGFFVAGTGALIWDHSPGQTFLTGAKRASFVLRCLTPFTETSLLIGPCVRARRAMRKHSEDLSSTFGLNLELREAVHWTRNVSTTFLILVDPIGRASRSPFFKKRLGGGIVFHSARWGLALRPEWRQSSQGSQGMKLQGRGHALFRCSQNQHIRIQIATLWERLPTYDRMGAARCETVFFDDSGGFLAGVFVGRRPDYALEWGARAWVRSCARDKQFWAALSKRSLLRGYQAVFEVGHEQRFFKQWFSFALVTEIGMGETSVLCRAGFRQAPKRLARFLR